MPTHEVSLNIHTKVVSHKDVEIEVKSDNQKLGTLLISKGNIEWLPSNVNKYRLSWEKFAQLMELEGSNVRM
jgi:hypothetical protein